MTASLDADLLLDRVRPVLAALVTDLADRATDPGVDAALRAEHTAELDARRTADAYPVWLDFRITQIGAAWVLSLLFVRTLEDRGLMAPRLKAGADHRAQLRALAPYLDDRQYLLMVFRELTRHRAVRAVFDPDHNPVWTLAPSADQAGALLAFCQSPTGLGGLDFSSDTRFLGDVYERLDEGVQKRFALLQTPDFVEDYILAGTLDRALSEWGVDGPTGQGLRLIDPTCGSGHFLLGGFARLVRALEAHAPAEAPEQRASRALALVHGTDLNPYAVAIARFRLVLAWLDAAGLTSLDAAEDLRLNLAVADSLLPVEGRAQQDLGALASGSGATGWSTSAFTAGASAEAQAILGGKRFEVVVGNPPYITVKDATLRDEYRARYVSAAGKYQLVVPFVERFFGLATENGHVGTIVGNGFMKRNFGKTLIEVFLPTVDLTHVIDTAGAFIPGHGTPTVILFGRQRPPQSDEIIAVMGKRGEPSTPEVPAEGLVWSSIRDHGEDIGWDDDYVSTEAVQREKLATHPWSLRGGGALPIFEHLQNTASEALRNTAVVGVCGMTNADDVMLLVRGAARRNGLRPELTSRLTVGEAVRDWGTSNLNDVVFPYDPNLELVDIDRQEGLHRFLWPSRAVLESRATFGGGTYKSEGRPWWEWHQLTRDRLRTPLTITFAEVATHNHFVLDRGGKVFKQTAPIIKLADDATEADHLALLGYLNSSTACFWMKMVSHAKSSGTQRHHPDPARYAYAFSATALAPIPLPGTSHREEFQRYAELVDRLSSARNQLLSSDALHKQLASAQTSQQLRSWIENREQQADHIRERMILLQEELDWLTYVSFGLIGPEMLLPTNLVAEGQIKRGDRPFELVNNRQSVVRENGVVVPLTECEVGSNTPLATDLHATWERRKEAIRSNRAIRLLETRQHKRMWRDTERSESEFAFRHKRRTEQLQQWLLDRLEAQLKTTTEPQSIARLARELSRDPKVVAVAEVLTDSTDPDLAPLLAQLAEQESVPHLAALRFKPKGLKKFRLWQQTWAAQRAEDAWEAGGQQGPRPKVPLPPKYSSADFAQQHWWRQRGKLDVPKERFIVYLGAEEGTSPVLGWAGWDHAQRMAALGHLLQQHEGMPEKETPLLAAMAELLPWVRQWHEDDDTYGTPLGPMWADHIEGERVKLGLSQRDLLGWTPPKTARSTSSSSKSSGRKRSPALRPEAVREALVALEADPNVDTTDGIERRTLEEALGQSSARVKTALQALIDAGEWTVVKQRPVTLARP